MEFSFEVYQHFKGGIYIKLLESVHTETGEELVHYICCASGQTFTRPKDMFYEKVERDGYKGPRFIRVPPIIGKQERKKLRIIENGSS